MSDFPASLEPHYPDPPHWQPGEHSEHPLVMRLLGILIYSETGYAQAHVTVGHDMERGQYLKGPDGQPVADDLVQRGWLLIRADGAIG